MIRERPIVGTARPTLTEKIDGNDLVVLAQMGHQFIVDSTPGLESVDYHKFFHVLLSRFNPDFVDVILILCA